MQWVYVEFVEEYMAMLVVKGIKIVNECFVGVDEIFIIEVFMQDGKVLQVGIFYFLGQNFVKVFDVKFFNKENQQEYVWVILWGVFICLFGGLIMIYFDDDGLVILLKFVFMQGVIVFILKFGLEIGEVVEKVMKVLCSCGICVKFDDDEKNCLGFKFVEYEMKGILVCIGIGKCDLEKGQVEIVCCDIKEKIFVFIDEVVVYIENLLAEIQNNFFEWVKQFCDDNIMKVDNFDDFKEVVFGNGNVEIEFWGGGFVFVYWDGIIEIELKIKELIKVMICCILFDNEKEEGQCVFIGKFFGQWVLFVKVY